MNLSGDDVRFESGTADRTVLQPRKKLTTSSVVFASCRQGFAAAVAALAAPGAGSSRQLFMACLVHTHHFSVRRNFHDSYIALHPRRSCEALWASLMECRFLEGSRIPASGSLDEIQKWMQPRIDVEEAA